MKRSRINPVNAERKQRMRTDDDGVQHTYGDYHKWVQTLRCAVTNKHGVDGHHIRSVKAGGQDYGNEIPLRRDLHVELHSIGPSRFQEKYGIDLEKAAEKVLNLWKARRENATLSRWVCQCRNPMGTYFCARCENVIPEQEDGT